MPTLLLRLAAPMQSWGVDSKFEKERRTESEPSKSAVVGMLAAALGMKRDADLSELSRLKFGVRIDKEGVIIRDFHTVCTVNPPYITNRYYLCDAVFLVGLESDNSSLLEKISYALKNPVYPLFLGRRSCPPTLPLVLRIREEGLEEALEREPILVESFSGKVRVRTETFGNGAMKQDLPLSFDPNERLFGYRKFKEYYISTGTREEHAAMKELEAD